MEVSIPDYRGAKLLRCWSYGKCNRPTYLNDLSEIYRWARPCFFALQQDFCHELQSRYHTLSNWHTGHASQIATRTKELPATLLHHLELLIQREIATLL
jgi:hypothetical protein